MSSTSNEDTNIANTTTTQDNQSEQQQQQQEPTQQDSGQMTVAGQGYTVDSTIKHRRRQQLDEQNSSPDPSLRGQQETDTSNSNTITTGADPAAVATGIPPKQQQRLEDNEQPENQE
jgi:hypothetical protein